ncbi:hypothetical protein PIB30_048771 [Stylosanthes scabra]|uniref:CCHC-type domain-containing protein n=1 Tax=Stylosanthes scabra TaxID=79078 RepID=A0ABU6TGU9_9FABA|nr:hypothetical protein [Stylosanthes scabra]
MKTGGRIRINCQGGDRSRNVCSNCGAAGHKKRCFPKPPGYAQTSTQNASQGGSKGRKKLPTRCAMKSFSQPLSNLPIGEGIETCYQEGQPHNPNLQQEQQRPMNHKKQEACPSQSSLMHLRHPTKGNGPSPPIMPPMKSLTQPSSKTKPMPKPTERAS